MNVKNITTENFAEEVLNSNVPVLVDFWATWCTPCKMMAPVIEKIGEEMGDRVKVCKVDIDQNTELATKYNVMSIPTFLVFQNGNVVGSSVGVQDKNELMELLK